MSNIKEIDYEGFKAINLSNSFISIITVPSLGGKIVSIENKKSGFDYAFKNKYIKNSICEYDSDFSLTSISGLDECFPTVALSKYTEFPWKGTVIPDHGEIWSQEAETEIVGNTIIQKVNGIRFPYLFNRAINIENNCIFLNYRIENLSTMNLKYIWSIHPHFNLLENTEILIDDNPKMSVDFTKNNKLELKTEKYKWPIAKTDDGKEINFSKISDISNGEAEKLYVGELNKGEVKLNYLNENESMIFRFNKDVLKYCGVFIDRAGWPFNDKPYKSLAIEPCNCISDRFEDSLKRGEFDMVKAKKYNDWKLELILE